MQTRQRSPRLSREAILEAAVELVDEQGLGALSMRSLASRLGVEAMSLYHHVPSKEALLDGIVEVVLDDVAASGRRGWRPTLRELAHRYRDVSRRHPRVLLLFSSRTLTMPSWRRAVEDTLAALRSGGFSDQETVHAYRVFWAYIVGYVLAELRLGESDGVDEYHKQLPASDYPATLALTSVLRDTDRDEEFARGVELLLDAIARFRRPARASRTRGPA
ncbi:MAG TPA: TetR/AcrR family transcriptional regulator C-terminal domain-containing protein [Gaiellaceae bacterium]|nr:TetR/AcrR family transcriptional regulator C-terminal domain-containing protein [Gaiellaceae bacterium]